MQLKYRPSTPLWYCDESSLPYTPTLNTLCNDYIQANLANTSIYIFKCHQCNTLNQVSHLSKYEGHNKFKIHIHVLIYAAALHELI